jgi:starch synthase
MPSKSEPCGLSQMIASRYGAIPVVRETGGLYDSIKGFWVDGDKLQGNGFTFANYNASELEERTGAAIDLWNDESLRTKFVGKIMRIDFSWKNSAQSYLDMYAPLWN